MNILINIKQEMAKTEKKQDKIQNKSNKVHKTLRDKLRKKREQLKRHKKEKSQQKKQYNAEEEKLKFFSKGEDKQDNGQELKLKKIKKYIEAFINIYEDDLEQFYDMFKTFDDNGFIDISGLQNKALHKCLKKLFKYLPLRREKNEFRKVEGSKINLEKFMKQKVSESIENYLQNGSNNEDDNDQSSGQQHQDKKKSKKNNKKVKVDDHDGEVNLDQLKLYKETIAESKHIGPYIPEQFRIKIAEQFDQQLQEMKKNKDKIVQQEQDEFAQMFNGKTRKQLKTVIPDSNQSVPQHLMAKGSALIGQKVEVDDDEINEYNRINRPKKLIDLHKQLNQGSREQDNKRKPFSRQRDVLGQGKQSLMTNSTFFDFKSRMSKPQGTNQFL